MLRIIMLVATVTAALAIPGAAQRHTRLPEGTWVVIVGRISSPPNGTLNHQKMQVEVGPREVDYTLHFPKAAIRTPKGAPIDEDRLDDGQWVRAEGRVMDDPRRIRVSRLKVISPHDRMASIQGTPYFRRGYPYGYITWKDTSRVAGSRQIYRAN
jgi:hypothetical protein